jgi:basic amino acid/polyamine antiporter, APA family
MGELAAMMPHAGGMYVYLREAFSPIWGFLYGWTLWTVIQTGTIATVAIAFARFCGVLFPVISEQHYLYQPHHLGSRYAISLSTAQLLAIVVIVVLACGNSLGLKYGKLIQNKRWPVFPCGEAAQQGQRAGVGFGHPGNLGGGAGVAAHHQSPDS